MWETKIGYALHAQKNPLGLHRVSITGGFSYLPSHIFVQGLYIWEPQALWLMPLLLFVLVASWYGLHHVSSCLCTLDHQMTRCQSVGHVDFGPETERVAGWKACWWWWHTAAWIQSCWAVSGVESRRDLVRGLRRIVVHCGFPKQLYVSYEGVSLLPAISWPRTACGVAKAGIFLNHEPRVSYCGQSHPTIALRRPLVLSFGQSGRGRNGGVERATGSYQVCNLRVISLPLTSVPTPFSLLTLLVHDDFYILLRLCLKLKDGNNGFEWLPGPMCCAGSARGQPCGTWFRPMM